MKERVIFWTFTAVFISACICVCLFVNSDRNSKAVDISSITQSSPNSADAPQEASFTVNINTADKEELMLLEGIGDVIAQSIIDYRTENGAFLTIEEIMEVNGIGEKKYEKIKNFIVVTD